MFKKLLIANRGDNRSEAQVAAKAHVRAADVKPEPNRVVRVANGDRVAGA